MMDDDTRKEVLVAYQKRKQEEILHPFLKERVAFGLCRTFRRCFWLATCGAIWTATRVPVEIIR